jgi:hypothetical protein
LVGIENVRVFLQTDPEILCLCESGPERKKRRDAKCLTDTHG